MRLGVFVALLVFLCVGMSEAREVSMFGMLDMTEKSDIVAVCTVELMNSYWAEDIHNGTIMTDVLVRVDELIKGQPTLGTSHVKFAIEGGTAYIPKKNKVLSLDVHPQPEFEIGERALLFLRVGAADSYYKNFPHGRLHVYMWEIGKKDINDAGIAFGYEYESKVKQAYIPLDLTKVLIKSYLKDKDAAKRIENEIKGLVTKSSREVRSVELPATTASGLKDKAKSILKKEKK